MLEKAVDAYFYLETAYLNRIKYLNEKIYVVFKPCNLRLEYLSSCDLREVFTRVKYLMCLFYSNYTVF